MKHLLCTLVFGTVALGAAPGIIPAQATTSPAQSAARQIGTVRKIDGSTLTVAPDAGATVSVTLGDNVRVVQLPPGSTDLKSAQPATVSDIAVGDRVLASGQAGNNGGLTATRIVLMKAGAIAQVNQAKQSDWDKRGVGGIVESIDPDGSIAIVSGKRKIDVHTTSSTVFRRYAPGSVSYQASKPGTLADIRKGDQLRARGERTPDGSTLTAEEIVSGSFRNLSGVITAVDTASATVSFKDLATKKPVTVEVGPETDLRQLPPEMAARFATRVRGNGSGSDHTPGGNRAPGIAGQHPQETRERPASPPNTGQSSTNNGTADSEERTRDAGGDLSQSLPHLPKVTLAELKSGEAVMVVASSAAPGSPITAITLLTGVEALLAAAPEGSLSLSPTNLGTEMPSGATGP